jgi:hypothetical protein
MSPAFLAILFLPLFPPVLGLVLVGHIAVSRHVPFHVVLLPFIKKLLSWGAIAAAAFAAFVVIATVVTGSPQGPLMLLFVSVPFALGEFIGLIAWAWNAYAT